MKKSLIFLVILTMIGTVSAQYASIMITDIDTDRYVVRVDYEIDSEL